VFKNLKIKNGCWTGLDWTVNSELSDLNRFMCYYIMESPNYSYVNSELYLNMISDLNRSISCYYIMGSPMYTLDF